MTDSKRKWTAPAALLLSATYLTPFATSGALAQSSTPQAMLVAVADSAPAAAAPATEEPSLGDIVVTATRTAESVQRVPISIQALSADKLSDRQVKGLSDFATLLPSVSFSGIGPGRQTPYFRGIVPAGGNYASVGYYLDDIPITGTGLPDIHIYDIERIEALSGPQGTLYGAGSLAGTIRIITNKPKLGAFQFGYNVEGNKYGKGAYGGQGEAYVNVPVGDSIAIRAMGYYRHDGGYIDNTPNNGRLTDVNASSVLKLGDNNPATSYNLSNAAIAKKDYNPIFEYGGRLEVLWQIAPGWDITPQVTAQRQISDGYFGYDPRVGDLQVHDYDTTRNNDRWYQAALAIHGHIGDFDIVSATGYYARKDYLRNDYSYYTVTYDQFGAGYENYLQFFDKGGCTGSGATFRCTKLINPTQFFHGLTNENKITQEVRITTPKRWPFDVTFGGFHQSQKIESNTYYSIHNLDNIAGYTQAGGGDSNPAGFGVPTQYGGTMILGTEAVKSDGFYIVERNQYYHDEALFAEGHYNITPKLKLTGGLRYFWTGYKVLGFSGVQGSAANTTTSFYVPTGTFGCPTPLPAERLQCLNQNFAAADQIGRYHEHGETHKVALNWQFTPSKMVYANYSTGFRPGGFNRPLRIRGIGVATVPPFKSETLTNYEFGIKTTWHNIFRFNAAVYYEQWDNIQYSVVVSGTQGAGITGNAGKARVKGAEYDADLRLGKITISSSGAYNDAALKGNFCNFAFDPTSKSISQLSSCAVGAVFGSPPISQVAATGGTRLPRQPRFKGTTSIRYDTDIGSYRAYLQGAAVYQTNVSQNLNVFNNQLLLCGSNAAAAIAAGANCATTPGFVSFDFSAGIKKSNWTIDLFIQNAFEKRGILSKETFCSITFCSDSSRTFPIRPQFFGVRFGQKFG